MTILPRAATVGEQAKIRADNQSARFYLTAHVPAVVYSARLAAVPDSNDQVSAITYNTGSGTHTNILADMTLYVGTVAGAYDLGMLRIRNTSGIGATTGTFNIGRTSEIDWPANAYLTVVDEFAIFPRWPENSSGTVYMDTDVAYADQHRYCLSVPVFPRYAVKWLTGADVTVIRDGSQSWALNNTINSYQWAAPGSASISGDTTNTATITYDTANPTNGYRVSLNIGNTDGVNFTGYGRVFVLADEDDAITQFSVNSISGDYNSGGWQAQITCYAQADTGTIRDRALIIIHRRDWYGPLSSDEGSIGYVDDDENIEMVGWIDGESIKWGTDDKYGEVTFTIYGPQYWLNKITMPTVGLKNITHQPTNWKRFQGLTAKSATWHVLMWRTTAPRCIDVFPIENGWAALQLQSGGAQTVWQQLSNILSDFLLGKPCCDAYARLFLQREQQCLTQIERSAIPTVLSITKDDWANEINFDRREVNNIAAVDLTGEIYNGTNTSTAVYALSPGRVFSARGSSIFSRANLTVPDQATLNALAAAIYGWQNNPYPNWRFQFASNFHLIDVAPYQYLDIDIASTDTPREIVKNNLRLIPRQVRRVFRDGYLMTEVITEAETVIGMGVTGDTPADPPEIPTTPPSLPPPPPPPIPTPLGNAREVWMASSNAIYWAGDYFSTSLSQPTWNKITGLPGTVNRFKIAPDGSIVYLLCTVGGVQTLYKCTNPKAVTPSWDAIGATGNTIGGFVISVDDPNISINNGTLVTSLYRSSTGNRYYATYDGTAWALIQAANDYGYQTVYGHEIVQHNPAGLEFRLYTIPPFSLNHSWVGNTGGAWSQAYRNMIGGSVYIATISPGTGSDIRNETANSVMLNVGLTTTAEFIINGAPRGPHVYVVDTNGLLYISSDGTTIASAGSPWGQGNVMDMQLSGGGTLVWVLQNITGSGVPTRLYERDGSVISDKTGNFWDLAVGNQTIVDAGLVYA